jgi:hypothetical protein
MGKVPWSPEALAGEPEAFATAEYTKQRHQSVIDAYMAQANEIDVNDPESIKRAQLTALRESAYLQLPSSEQGKLRKFRKIWENPGTTKYIAQVWGFALDLKEPAEIVQRYAKRLDEIAMDREGGAKNSLAAITLIFKTVLPPQVQRLQTQSIVAHVSDPPAQYDDAPKMVATAVISAEQRAMRAQAEPIEHETDDEDDDDD